MVTRIATSYQNAATLRNLQQANANMALSTYQITTGLKSRTLSEDSGNANRILTLKDVQVRTDTYIANLGSASSQLTATESALQQMTDLITEATALATTGRNENSAETRSTLAPKAQAIAESFYNLLNTQYNGQYVFSGSNGNTETISGNAAATAFPGEPIDTSWYQGDGTLSSVVSGAGTTQEYGVLGNDDSFSKLKAGLEGLWYGLQNNNVTEMDTAISNIAAAKSSLTSLVSDVGGQMNNVDALTERYTNQKTFVKTNLDDLEQVDVSEALTTFSQQSSTLQASMMIIAQTNSLTLLDYIR